ncbi:MAG: hypothetical protein ACRDRL_31170 [Sciscionella sp.]
MIHRGGADVGAWLDRGVSRPCSPADVLRERVLLRDEGGCRSALLGRRPRLSITGTPCAEPVLRHRGRAAVAEGDRHVWVDIRVGL